MKHRRSKEKQIAAQEQDWPKTVESAVSQVLRERRSRTVWGRDLLRMTAVFVTDANKRKEVARRYGPNGYSTGRRAHHIDEKYIRAAIYVGGHDRFKDYEADFYAVYVEKDNADPFVDERLAEFEMALDSQLDRVPFEPERGDNRHCEAKDLLDILVPVTFCARLLGVHRSTLHRAIDHGLITSQVSSPYPPFKKEGRVYKVNYLAALRWMEGDRDGD